MEEWKSWLTNWKPSEQKRSRIYWLTTLRLSSRLPKTKENKFGIIIIIICLRYQPSDRRTGIKTSMTFSKMGENSPEMPILSCKRFRIQIRNPQIFHWRLLSINNITNISSISSSNSTRSTSSANIINTINIINKIREIIKMLIVLAPK